jgi:acyl-coenzyme A synthetase/AMP-(fatty) acid ligase
VNAKPMTVMIGRDRDWLTSLAELLAALPPDARVVICAKSGPILAGIVLACLDQGLVAVPLDPRTSDARLESIATRVSASLVIDGRAGTSRGAHIVCRGRRANRRRYCEDRRQAQHRAAEHA